MCPPRLQSLCILWAKYHLLTFCRIKESYIWKISPLVGKGLAIPMKSKFGSFWWERKTQKLTTPNDYLKNHKLCDITWNLVGKWNAPRSKGDPLKVTRVKHQTAPHDLSYLEVQVYFSRIVLQSSIYSNFCSM